MELQLLLSLRNRNIELFLVATFRDNTLLNPTTITLTESAIYTLTVTDGNGCSNEDQMEIIITVEELSVNPNASNEEICFRSIYSNICKRFWWYW